MADEPVIDPTANVIANLEAAVGRLDDLRTADQLLQTERMRHLTEMAELRAQHAAEMREGESARLDAIRAVDVGAAAILANQVSASAEALRAQVEVARQQTAVGQAAALEPIQKDIADLRRVQYEQAGQKSAGTEQHTDRIDARTFLIGIAGLLVAVALIIAPHIH